MLLLAANAEFFKRVFPVLHTWKIPLQSLFFSLMLGFLERRESFQDILPHERISPHYLKATQQSFPVLHFQYQPRLQLMLKIVPLLSAWGFAF